LSLAFNVEVLICESEDG